MTKNANEEINVLDYFMEKIGEGGSTIEYVFNSFKSDELVNAIYEQNKQLQRLKENYNSLTKIIKDTEKYYEFIDRVREEILIYSNISGRNTKERQNITDIEVYISVLREIINSRQDLKKRTRYDDVIKLQKENEELKHRVKIMMHCPECKVDEYKQALENIKNLLLDGGNSYREQMELRFATLDKINEVLDETNENTSDYR